MKTNCWCGGAAAIDSDSAGVAFARCLESEQHDPFSTGVPDRVMDIYVAGPMSGYPENNYPAFNEAAQRLRDVGYNVINPAEFVAEPGRRYHYIDLLRDDLIQMMKARGVCILPDWWNSTGARNEVNVAGLLKMPVRPLGEWLERAHHELSLP